MKKEKMLTEAQMDCRSTAWPDAQQIDRFDMLTREVRDAIVPNLDLDVLNEREARVSWRYRADLGQWTFEITATIAVEVAPGETGCGTASQLFTLDRVSVAADIRDAAAKLAAKVRAWRSALHAMRTLHLKSMYDAGSDEFFDAVGRG